MKFSDITGHREEIQKLRLMADNRKLPHAILLHGPAGIGKTMVARAFVQYIFCESPQGGDSCGRCPSCLQTAKLNNPDLHYIFPVLKNSSHPLTLSSEYAEEWEKFISKYPYMPEEQWLEIIDAGNSRPMIYVTESEELLRQSSLSAYGKGYKVFVVWLPEKMNVEAANKILKVIEEPFSDTIFVFISNNPGAIISTIRSRLQGVEFKSLPESDIIAFLCSRGKTCEEAASLAKIAGGNMNKASGLVAESGELSEFTRLFMGVMRAAYARKMVELKNFADTFAGFGREKAIRLLDYFARMIRESFISNLKCDSLEAMTTDEKQFVSKFGPFVNAANVEEIISGIDKARTDISRNANQKIVWFDFLIELTRLIRTKGISNANK